VLRLKVPRRRAPFNARRLGARAMVNIYSAFIDHDGRQREHLREDLRMDSHGILESHKSDGGDCHANNHGDDVTRVSVNVTK